MDNYDLIYISNLVIVTIPSVDSAPAGGLGQILPLFGLLIVTWCYYQTYLFYHFLMRDTSTQKHNSQKTTDLKQILKTKSAATNVT